MESAKRKDTLTRVGIHVFLILIAVVMVVPFVWMALTAFKTVTESTSVNPFVILPSSWKLDNFTYVWDNYNFLTLYINTLLMILFRVICAVLTATLAGYAFGRLRFPGKNLLFGLVLVQMMVPPQIFLLPQYLMVSNMEMLNTQFALVFPGIVTAFGTYLLKVSYQSLPKDLEEAAAIDGCNIGQRFLFVMAPLARSGMVSLGIFTAVIAFKELMWPMIACTNTTSTSLSAALAKMQGQFSTNYPQLMAAALFAILPMTILYLIFQKQFVEGIATSGGKL
ncbi:carbohydrate ABC transporter permease [Anaerobium acetethylicum]|uniref:Multiple sugar transport system permease protein n=1 Tax=Anaerobium acetethylicum TaxID=1619234 RepID=A0A1D3TZ05_9FIRM|nr:carbohydrate ABC transporter permease [Anaerobium acetethylicum]SCP99761.1 multiple sugar transport system permease protein [Anaerobium acetethylicum]